MVGKPFQKGQSGNPGGRPKVVAEVTELARQHTAEAIEALVAICTKGKSEAARASAAVALLDRGYGRPAQTMDITHHTPAVDDLSDTELADIARRGRRGASEAESGKGKLPSIH